MVFSLRRTFSCPVELSLEVLGGKWKTVILAHLKGGPLRYRDLKQRTGRLSDKVLSERLRDLEELGLVSRSACKREVHYGLTPRGASLGAVLQALHDWGEGMAPELGAQLPARRA